MVPGLHHAIDSGIRAALDWGPRGGDTPRSGALVAPWAPPQLQSTTAGRATHWFPGWATGGQGGSPVFTRARLLRGSLPDPRPLALPPRLCLALPRLSTTKSPGQNSLLSRWCTGKRSLERMLHSTEPSCHITSAEVIVVTTSTATLQRGPSEPGHRDASQRKGQEPSLPTAPPCGLGEAPDPRQEGRKPASGGSPAVPPPCVSSRTGPGPSAPLPGLAFPPRQPQAPKPPCLGTPSPYRGCRPHAHPRAWAPGPVSGWTLCRDGGSPELTCPLA